ncbi:hypothetical protein Y1Q_0005212 [Alligator mississippiensis]|uniref:Uncharacterized protein n=1 Tax=Alligator mississippiensis TaxID=8496 RepID=A0A151MT07_ALLMI|nr:hypothetical protein Y1Q_0005212 [Alligator mississippiensis]
MCMLVGTCPRNFFYISNDRCVRDSCEGHTNPRGRRMERPVAYTSRKLLPIETWGESSGQRAPNTTEGPWNWKLWPAEKQGWKPGERDCD